MGALRQLPSSCIGLGAASGITAHGDLAEVPCTCIWRRGPELPWNACRACFLVSAWGGVTLSVWSGTAAVLSLPTHSPAPPPPHRYVLANSKQLPSGGYCSVQHLVLSYLAQQRNPISCALVFAQVLEDSATSNSAKAKEWR